MKTKHSNTIKYIITVLYTSISGIIWIYLSNIDKDIRMLIPVWGFVWLLYQIRTAPEYDENTKYFMGSKND